MIEIEHLQGATVLRVTETRFEAANAPLFRTLTTDIVTGDNTQIALDLTSVKTIDSSGLGAIIGLLKRVGAGGGLRLFGLSSSVQKVVTLTRMDRVLSIDPDRDSALTALSA